jgi:serine/threonine-protein kinase RsbW
MSSDGALLVVLGNSLSAIDAGRLEILRHLEPRALSTAAINRFEVIFEELISNTLRHGFTPHVDQRIRVRVASRPGTIELTIEDEGTPFNPLDMPPPPPFESLETIRIGGLGIPLVRDLSTDIRYEAIHPGGAVVEMDGRRFDPRNRLTVSIAA